MSNQNYGPDGQPTGAPQGQQPPPLPNRGGSGYSSQYPGSAGWSAQNTGARPPGQADGQSGYPSSGPYPAEAGGQYASGPSGQPNFGGYGQQPPGSGQPYYGAGGPPGGQFPPAPPAGKGGKGKWIAIGAILLILAIAAAWALTRLNGDPTSPVSVETQGGASAPTVPSAPATGGTQIDELEVGQCIQFVEVPGATPNADGSISSSHQVVDCHLAGQFKWQVATVTNGPSECPTSDYMRYYQTGYLGSQFTNLSICVSPVFDIGVCYSDDPVTGDWVEAACTDPNAYFKIENELTGTDASACSLPDYAMSLPDPAPGKVYCLVDALA